MQKINDRRFFTLSINRNFIKFFIILSFFLPFSARANIIINEIAWMGTNVSYNDEWIELYNNGEMALNLDGWILKAEDGIPEINLFGTIPGQGFFLLERTDDDTLPNISADLIYKGALGNDGENLKLYNASGELADQVSSFEDWPAGDNNTKQTMERIDSNWQTSQEPGGTPGKENQALPAGGQELGIRNYEEEIKEEIKTEEKTKETGSLPETRSLESLEIEFYPKGIVFNEILASPDGPDEENEWIEIYNVNDFEIDLSQWKIQDTAGKSTSYALNRKIPALGYLVFLRPETKITLNNDGDGLNLINPNGEIADSIFFGKALLNQSYAKTLSGWTWTTNLTPGEKNIVSVPVVSAKIVENKNQKSVEVRPQRINLESNIRESSKIYIFLIAVIVALFCSIAFLIIKGNLKSFRD